MLTGTDLGAALDAAIKKLTKTPGTGYTSRTELASALAVSGPAVAGWCKTGSIKKDRLIELWKILAKVVPPEHFGLTAWPWSTDASTRSVASEQLATYNPHQWLIDAYTIADKHTCAAIELLLTPDALANADPLISLAVAQLKQLAIKTLNTHKSKSAAA